MKVHKMSYCDQKVYVYSFVYKLCDGPAKMGTPKGLFTFNSKKVTCPKCRKLDKEYKNESNR